jgi:hypothetical protein
MPRNTLSLAVMAGLVPAIHAFRAVKAWMPVTSTGMTGPIVPSAVATATVLLSADS